MFIEITEYDDGGDKQGLSIINTDDIFYIGPYSSYYKLWEIKLDNKNQAICIYIKKDSYEKIKKVLIKSNNECVGDSETSTCL